MSKSDTGNSTLLTNIFQYMEVRHILSTYIFSQMVDIPEGERYQINEDTYLRLIGNPEKPLGNVLIIQGGIHHMNTKTYYIRTASILMSAYNVRIWVFEKLLPMANPAFSHDIAAVLKFIRKKFSGPITVIGYSMGGVLLFNYLASGYDQADLYIPACCTLNMKDFTSTVASHALFNSLQYYSFKECGVDDHQSLLEAAGTTVEEYNQFTEHFIDKLNATQPTWLNKLIYVISANDPLTKDYSEYLTQLTKFPFTYLVDQGWHCCFESLQLTVNLAGNYIIARSRGETPTLEEIKC